MAYEEKEYTKSFDIRSWKKLLPKICSASKAVKIFNMRTAREAMAISSWSVPLKIRTIYGAKHRAIMDPVKPKPMPQRMAILSVWKAVAYLRAP